jgi:hypothetical protein
VPKGWLGAWGLRRVQLCFGWRVTLSSCQDIKLRKHMKEFSRAHAFAPAHTRTHAQTYVNCMQGMFVWMQGMFVCVVYLSCPSVCPSISNDVEPLQDVITGVTTALQGSHLLCQKLRVKKKT